ncbi:MAG: sodium-dependent transporter, partial [Cyclobacteriaceae bacterium]
GDMQQVTEPGFGGPGLIFVTLPGVFENIGGTLGIIVGSFFFLLLSFAALTSTVSLLEVPVAYVVDEHKVGRTKAVWLVAGIIFLIGIPSLLSGGYSEFFSNFSRIIGVSETIDSDFLSFVAATADVLLLLGGCLIVFFAGHVWKKHNLNAEIAQGFEGYDKSFVKTFLNFAITILCPILLALLFVMVLLNNFFGISLI